MDCCRASIPPARDGFALTACVRVSQVRNWADMDHLWRYTFDEKMHVNCADHKVWLNPMPWLRIWIR